MKCLLHIGTEKTGTSSIQEFLAQNRSALRLQGFLYPQSAGPQGHPKLAAYAQRDSNRDDLRMSLCIREQRDLEDFRRSFEEELDAEIQAAIDHRVHTVILSSEHCQSRLESTEEIRRLKCLLDRWFDEFEVIVYFRRQDRMAASLYSTMMKFGGTRDTIFPKLRPTEVPYYYDFAEMAQNWIDVFGATAISARLFQRGQLHNDDVVEDFCKLTGIVASTLKPATRVNESLSDSAMEFLRIFNSHCPGFTDGAVNELRQDVVHILEKNYAGKGKRPTASEAREFMSRFHKTNERLGSLLFGGTNPFDDSYDDFPEVVDELDFNVEESVSLAAVLWQAKAAEVNRLRERVNQLVSQK